MKREEYAKSLKEWWKNELTKWKKTDAGSLYSLTDIQIRIAYMGELNKRWDRCACLRPEEIF